MTILIVANDCDKEFYILKTQNILPLILSC